MSSDPNVDLVEALERFLPEARRVVDEEMRRNGGQQPSSAALAQSLVALPICHEANDAGRRAALANQYVVSRPRKRSDEAAHETGADEGSGAALSRPIASGPYGRPLDTYALVSTGVVGMLLDTADHNFHAVAQDLASYLARSAGRHLGLRDPRRQSLPRPCYPSR